MIHSVTNLHGTNLTSCCWLCRWTVPWLSGAFYAVRETFLLVVRAPFRILHPCIRICLRCVQYVTVAATPCVDSCHYLGSSLTGFDYSYLLDSYWILPGGNGDQCTFLQSACLSVSAPLACKCILYALCSLPLARCSRPLPHGLRGALLLLRGLRRAWLQLALLTSPRLRTLRLPGRRRFRRRLPRFPARARAVGHEVVLVSRPAVRAHTHATTVHTPKPSLLALLLLDMRSVHPPGHRLQLVCG